MLSARVKHTNDDDGPISRPTIASIANEVADEIVDDSDKQTTIGKWHNNRVKTEKHETPLTHQLQLHQSHLTDEMFDKRTKPNKMHSKGHNRANHEFRWRSMASTIAPTTPYQNARSTFQRTHQTKGNAIATNSQQNNDEVGGMQLPKIELRNNSLWHETNRFVSIRTKENNDGVIETRRRVLYDADQNRFTTAQESTTRRTSTTDQLLIRGTDGYLIVRKYKCMLCKVIPGEPTRRIDRPPFGQTIRGMFHFDISTLKWKTFSLVRSKRTKKTCIADFLNVRSLRANRL